VLEEFHVANHLVVEGVHPKHDRTPIIGLVRVVGGLQSHLQTRVRPQALSVAQL